MISNDIYIVGIILLVAYSGEHLLSFEMGCLTFHLLGETAAKKKEMNLKSTIR